MRCDDASRALYAGESAPDLEIHLSACDECRLLAQDLAGRGLEGADVFVGCALGVALRQRDRRDQRQRRLQGWIDRVAGDLRADGGRPTRERAQVQERRHQRPVVDRIVVPQQRLAAQLPSDALQVAGAELARADLLAGPEHLDRGIKARAQILQIVHRPLAEHTVEDGIVGVVRRADDHPHQIPRHSPSLSRRLDLPRGERSHPSCRSRRPRAEAVSLSRAMAGGP